MTQGEFLKRLGIETRAVDADGEGHAARFPSDISGALKRLTDGGRGGMGSMFKVLAISEPQPHRARGLERRSRKIGRTEHS